MFTHKNLTFEHGEILTRAMLQEIYKYPREFLRLKYSGYSDGIICGVDFFSEGGEIFLSAGIMKIGGEFYFLAENVNLSDLAEKNNLEVDREYCICLKKSSQKNEPCLTENNFEIIFSKENLTPTLGNFIFTARDNFNFPALAEGENPFERIFRRSVFNLFDVKFAASGGATFHPMLLRVVKNFLCVKENKTPLDYAILTQLQNAETISLQTIKFYIAQEGKNLNFSSRKDLFKTFCDCLITSQFKVNYVLNQQETETANKRRFSPKGKLL